MKRALTLLLLGLWWSHDHRLLAQESAESELEFVLQLRNKGWNDLAKTKLEALSQSKDPVLLAALPLELARVNIAIARQQDPEQRFGLFTAARTQLQEFIQKNQGNVQGARATAELARLTSYHAQALLSKAMREEDNKNRHEKARPAEEKFIQAGKDLDAAEQALNQALKNPANVTWKKILDHDLQQIRFDKATNLFDQARTYIDKSKDVVNAQRSEVMSKAKKAFTELRKDESSKVGWLANAWLMKVAMELDAPDEVNQFHDYVMKRKEDKTASDAIRLVRFFNMQDVAPPRPNDLEAIGRNPKYAKMKPMERLHYVQKEGENWLKTYPGYLKTYEGQGVLHELALAYLIEADSEKDKKLQNIHYEKAVTYLDKLSEMEGDLAEQGRQLSSALKFKRLDVKSDLKTFDEYMMKAMIERDKVREASAKLDQPKLSDKTQLEKERDHHLKEVIKSLSMAMAMATSKTPIKKVDDARYFLSGAYIAHGDLYRAAIIAEALARNRSPRSAEGAATAIATYSALHSRQPENTVIRKRMEDLAEYVLAPENQRTWGSDPVTSLAHYHLAMAAKREGKTKLAIQHLEVIKSDFTDYIYTQGQLVFIGQAALEKVGDDKKEKAEYTKAIKAAIERMPSVNPTESASVIAMYFFAKMELAKLMYAEAIEDLNAREELKAVKKCTDMTVYVKGLMGQFERIPAGKISNENHDQIQFSMSVMLKYADLGIAEVKFRSDSKDRFDQVIAATKGVVDQMLEQGKKVPGKEPIKLKDFRVTGDILGLALRANVQKGDVAKGKVILDVLNRLSDLEGRSSSNAVTLLLNDIAGQIRRMPKDDPTLKATKGNYSAFLDEIAKEFDAKGWDSNAATMIGHALVSLEMPCKAVQAFSKVKAPAALDKKVDKKPNPKETDKEVEERQKWEEDISRYWGVQVEYVRSLRGCKEKDSLKTAEKILDTLLKHPNARFQIQAMMERNLLLEDQQRYREAYLEWSKKFLIMGSIKDRSKKEVQNIYFPGYFYMTRTLYKMAMFDPGIKDRKRFVEAAAKQIIQLEFSATKEGWEIAGPLFQELLKGEQPLRDEYDKQKANRLKGALWHRPDRQILAARCIIEAPFLQKPFMSGVRRGT